MGQSQGSFVMFRQGAIEMYVEFINQLQAAIKRQIPHPKAAKLLKLQLAFENVNKDCQAAITPVRATATEISMFIKACQNVGTTTNLAQTFAAMMTGTTCYNYGQIGHVAKGC